MPNKYTKFSGDIRTDTLRRYTEKIEDCLVNISSLFNLYEAYNIETPPPCAINYRDALFHYIKLYEADEVDEAITQGSNIDEHLDRLIKDSYVNFLQILLQRIGNEYAKTCDNEQKKCLQRSMHTLKRHVLTIRTVSLQIHRLFQSGERIRSLTDGITSVTHDMSKHGLLSVLIPQKQK